MCSKEWYRKTTNDVNDDATEGRDYIAAELEIKRNKPMKIRKRGEVCQVGAGGGKGIIAQVLVLPLWSLRRR